MMLLLGIAIGVVVGWLVPRPAWFDNLFKK